MTSTFNDLNSSDALVLQGRVLVVDDEPTNRLTLRMILEKAGCTVCLASDGPEALELAKQNPPDLAVVDVMMPGMNGFEVCRRLKADKKTSYTPVIMVTSLQDVQDLEKGFNAGATDYVTKPFRARELLARVRNSLILKSSTDKLRRQSQKLAREIELAGALQKTMLELPPFLSNEMFISYEYRPSMNVSGDMFDQVVLPDGRLCVYLADAAGHGVAAALMSSFLKSAALDVVRSQAYPTPSAICEELNTRFLATIKMPTAYATLFLGIFDPASNTWNCMNCGHPSPVFVSKDGKTSFPFQVGGGLPIGLAARKVNFTQDDEVLLRVEPGDTLFFYTDGLNEASHAKTGEECGQEILADAMRKTAAHGLSIRSSDRVISSIAELDYAVGEDDCSVVSIHMLDPEKRIFDAEIPATYEAIEKMSAAVEQALLKREWPAICAMSVQLLLLEHCNNTVRHGKLKAEKSMRIRVHLTDAQCLLSVLDPSSKWDYQKMIDAAETMPDELEESGRGIAMIRRIAPHPEYIYFRDGNQNSAFFVVEKEVSF